MSRIKMHRYSKYQINFQNYFVNFYLTIVFYILLFRKIVKLKQISIISLYNEILKLTNCFNNYFHF